MFSSQNGGNLMAKAFRRSEVVRAAVVSPKMVESPGKLKKSPVKLRYLAYLYGPVKRTGRPGCTFQQGLSEKKNKNSPKLRIVRKHS